MSVRNLFSFELEQNKMKMGVVKGMHLCTFYFFVVGATGVFPLFLKVEGLALEQSFKLIHHGKQVEYPKAESHPS